VVCLVSGSPPVKFRSAILSLPQCEISEKVLFLWLNPASAVLVAGGESEGASRGRGEPRLLGS
jgi:hypothetical protein